MNREHRGEHQRDDSKDPARRTVALNQPPNLHAEAVMVVVAVGGLGALGWIFPCAILQVTRLPFLAWNGGSVTARRWVERRAV